MSERRAKTAIIVAAALASPSCAGAAPNPCIDLAVLIRAGLADGDGKGAPFSQFLAMAARSNGHLQVDNSGGADVEAVFRRALAPPGLVRAVQEQAAKSDGIEPRVFWFGGSGLGMVLSAGAFPACPPYVVFFKATQGRLETVPAPDVSIHGNACTTMAPWATTIGDVPVFVEQDDRVGASREHLTLVPWENGAWGEACGLTLTYTMLFRGTGNFCRSDVNCKDMAAVAQGISLRFKTDMEKGLNALADGAAADVQDELVKLASLNSDLGELPTFSKDPNAWPSDPKGPPAPVEAPELVREATGLALTDHGYTGEVPPHLDPKNEIQMELAPGTRYLHRYLYPVKLSGALTADGMALGVIGLSRSINSPIGGLLISIWARSGAGLTPIAGFQNVAVRSRVAQVSVDSAL